MTPSYYAFLLPLADVLAEVRTVVTIVLWSDETACHDVTGAALENCESCNFSGMAPWAITEAHDGSVGHPEVLE